MPRELSLASTRPVTLDTLVEAGRSVDGTLVPRTLFGGWAIQLVSTGPAAEPRAPGEQARAGEPTEPVAVLTLELSRRIDERYDLERLTGPVPFDPGAELWFTEATAPWGPYGEVGVRIVRRLGELLGARVIVEDGT